MTDKTATLNLPGGDFEFPVLEGTVGPDVFDIRKLYGQAGVFTYDPGFTSTASCESAITYIDGEKGILLHRGYPIDQLAEQSTFMEVSYLLLHGELPKKAELDDFTWTIIAPHDAARAARDLLPRLPARRPPDGDHVRSGRRAVGFLSRQHRHHRSRAADDRVAPADRQDADDRRDGLQIFDRPAVPLSGQQPQLHRQLPADDLRRSGRALRDQSGDRAGDAADLHPPRRPRAECLDLDGAAGRLVGRQPVRLHRGGNRLPVGTGARRRQRSCAQHAARDRDDRQHPRNISPAPRTRTTRSG